MCWDGNFVAVQRLLDDGADLDILERAEVKGHVGNWPPHCGIARTPLQFACIKGHLEVVRLLLDSGADMEAADYSGSTPLHYACDEGHPQVARLLLDGGADMETADHVGDTPLHDACYSGRLELVRLLLDRGAERESGNEVGRTPLHVACSVDQPEVVRLLVDGGADKEAADLHGYTPLVMACDEGDLEIIKLLLQRGATAIQEHIGEEEGEPVFPEESNALLRKWHALTPARRDAVLRLGWDYIDVPTRWTPQNHSQFPADFQQQVATIALAWQFPLAALNGNPGDLVQQMAEGAHAQMGLQ